MVVCAIGLVPISQSASRLKSKVVRPFLLSSHSKVHVHFRVIWESRSVGASSGIQRNVLSGMGFSYCDCVRTSSSM